jgi:hypothetical protein
LPPPQVRIGDAAHEVAIPLAGGFSPPAVEAPAPTTEHPHEDEVEVPLLRLALARSGDKGNSSNIAIIARKAAYVPILRRVLTAERIAEHFAGLVHGPVQRFEAPGLNAFNFLLDDALGGGGMASLRIDPQGKAYGQMALELMIPVPRSVAEGL